MGGICLGNRVYVNIDEIDTGVKKLKILKDRCEIAKKKKFPSSSHDKGELHNELDALHKNVISSWKTLENLIDKSIQFLSGMSKNITQNEKISSKAVKK